MVRNSPSAGSGIFTTSIFPSIDSRAIRAWLTTKRVVSKLVGRLPRNWNLLDASWFSEPATTHCARLQAGYQAMTYRALRFPTTLLASTAFLSLATLPPQPASSQTQETINVEALKPAATGYAESAEGLRVYYEVYGQGEPIVVMAGGLMDISTMAQT